MPGDGGVLEIQPNRGRESEDGQEKERGAGEQAVHQCSGAARMVMTAFVMIVIRKDRPGRAGEPVLMRGDSSSAVQWGRIARGGKGK